MKSVEVDDNEQPEDYTDLGKKLPTGGRKLELLLLNSYVRLLCSPAITHTYAVCGPIFPGITPDSHS